MEIHYGSYFIAKKITNENSFVNRLMAAIIDRF